MFSSATVIYTLSLHDALPIFLNRLCKPALVEIADEDSRALFCATLGGGEADTGAGRSGDQHSLAVQQTARPAPRSEEHTSELQSLRHLVCRLLLEKKKTHNNR